VSRIDGARPSLATLGIDARVPVITRDQVNRAKPDPDLFLRAADALGTSIFDCIVVGDSVWDLLAARRARALGVGLASGGYGQDELERAGAYRTYEDPLDLPAILLAPTVESLFSDAGLAACHRLRLAVRVGYFNLPQNIHDLLWGMLLRLAHTSPLLFQFRSTKLVQNLPGTPFRVGRRLGVFNLGEPIKSAGVFPGAGWSRSPSEFTPSPCVIGQNSWRASNRVCEIGLKHKLNILVLPSGWHGFQGLLKNFGF
jgi:hypothetical protein